MLRFTVGVHRSIERYFQSRYYSMDLGEVVKRLNKLAPTNLAESWDNVGLLLEPHSKREIKSILLTNDLTEDVMDEAEHQNVNFILSYHPPLFRPFKKITSKAWKERIVARCLEKGIAIYSPHTAYDALAGGVNDWLLQAFGCEKGSPLQNSQQCPQYSHQLTVKCRDDQEAGQLLSKLNQHLGNQCVSYKTETSCVILCREDVLTTAITCLQKEELSVQFTITKLEKVPFADQGMGRKCKLSSPLTLRESVDKIKAHLNLPFVRLAIAHGATYDSPVSSVAVCAGSGSSVLRGSKTDLWLTGEMSHHEVLDAVHQGTSLVLTDHSNTERGFLKVLQPRLVELFDQKVQVVISKKDKDPLQVV